jgi:putative polyketide hydroxylase
VSTLDLFGEGFVLLAGADGAAWHTAALRAADRLGVPFDGYVLGDSATGFAEAYGISQAGAVLVRPDGVVAWRAVGADSEPEVTVGRALASVVCKQDGEERV